MPSPTHGVLHCCTISSKLLLSLSPISLFASQSLPLPPPLLLTLNLALPTLSLSLYMNTHHTHKLNPHHLPNHTPFLSVGPALLSQSSLQLNSTPEASLQYSASYHSNQTLAHSDSISAATPQRSGHVGGAVHSYNQVTSSRAAQHQQSQSGAGSGIYYSSSTLPTQRVSSPLSAGGGSGSPGKLQRLGSSSETPGYSTTQRLPSSSSPSKPSPGTRLAKSYSTTVAVTTAGGGGSPQRVASPPNSTSGGGASSSSSPLHQMSSGIGSYATLSPKRLAAHHASDQYKINHELYASATLQRPGSLAVFLFLLQALEKKRKKQECLQEEIMRINAETMQAKERRLEEERQADMRDMEYLKNKMERASEYEAEQKRLKKEKELEIARLRARQEKAKDYKAEQDELRARRNQEFKDRDWRSKQRELAVKRAQEEEMLMAARTEQVRCKEHFLSIEAGREKAEFERVLSVQQQAIVKLKEEEEKRRQKLSRHSEAIRTQVKEQELSAVAKRRELFKESERLMEEDRQRRVRLEEIKEKKLQELKSVQRPESAFGVVDGQSLKMVQVVCI
ncbi:uncharacterized protein [Notothenia coriiceps]|uniref:Cilia- and flagella-associated protein 45 n=1 Tax=Notothenia coriiceps TaxID=8208 RepID=A0A6I9NPS2_9TELE|nr:PREDICTED: uncharacterized protein LOC104951718 [Notothenia coriiceps]